MVRLVHSVRYVQISGVQCLLAHAIYLQIGSFLPFCRHTFRAFWERCLQRLAFPVSSATLSCLLTVRRALCSFVREIFYSTGLFFLCEWLNSAPQASCLLIHGRTCSWGPGQTAETGSSGAGLRQTPGAIRLYPAWLSTRAKLISTRTHLLSVSQEPLCTSPRLRRICFV